VENLLRLLLLIVLSDLIPGVISDETSALSDSFQDNLLAPPVYTRPAEYKGWKVPDILLSGNAKEIEKWQMEQSIERTKKIEAGFVQETLEICVVRILVYCSNRSIWTSISKYTNKHIHQ
jgi:tRNA (guanine-N1)-methyltransferase